jgi:hypothetical protein
VKEGSEVVVSLELELENELGWVGGFREAEAEIVVGLWGISKVIALFRSVSIWGFTFSGRGDVDGPVAGESFD